MKVVILAGGLGTRLSEETHIRPKPMVEIGSRPIVWHIMKYYSNFGYKDFVLCLGYRGSVVKEFFSNYQMLMSDISFDLADGSQKFLNSRAEQWNVTLVDTGLDTETAGRIRRIAHLLPSDGFFLLTYGDGLADVDIDNVIQSHLQSTNLVTLTAVQPPGKYGALEFDGESVVEFREKPLGDQSWINGGFFVCSTSVLSYLNGDDESFERDVLPRIARDGKLGAYKHQGFWKPMDTLRDKMQLEELWSSGDPPWKVWPD